MFGVESGALAARLATSSAVVIAEMVVGAQGAGNLTNVLRGANADP
jgi:hypothetical protein